MDKVYLRLVRGSAKDCKHTRIDVDEKLWMITCQDCGKQLDPIKFIVDIANKQECLEFRLDELERIKQEALSKTRCKCVHCGNITPIVRVPLGLR